jgi:hypothetical protein
VLLAVALALLVAGAWMARVEQLDLEYAWRGFTPVHYTNRLLHPEHFARDYDPGTFAHRFTLAMQVYPLAARWLGKYGISVNVVNPGPVETEGAVYGQDQLDVFARVIPLKRKDVGTVLGLPQDMANAVLFLASDLSSYITGACINVSGGQVMG